MENVLSEMPGKRPGYWTAVSKRVDPGTWQQQHREILSKLPKYPGVAIWDERFSKRFGQSLDGFLAEYFRKPTDQRFINEYMYPSLPCKLFFDMEYETIRTSTDPKVPNTKDEHIFSLTDRLLKICLDQLQKSIPKATDQDRKKWKEECVVAYSNIESKRSVHLVFQVVFKDIQEVKRFVQEKILPIVEKEPGFTVFKADSNGQYEACLALDMSVYASTRIFRMYGSNKWVKAVKEADGSWIPGYSKRNPLLPLSQVFTERECVRSLIFAVAVTPDEVKMVRATEIFRDVWIATEVWQFGTTRARKRSKKDDPDSHPRGGLQDRRKRQKREDPVRPVDPSAEAVVDRVLKNCPLFNKQSPEFLSRDPVKYESKAGLMVQIAIHSKNNPHAIICPTKGTSHQSNCQYFHLNLDTGIGYFTCPDIACMRKKQHVWGKQSFREFM